MSPAKRYLSERGRIPHYCIELRYNKDEGKFHIQPNIRWSYIYPKKWYNYKPDGNLLVYPMYWNRVRASKLLLEHRIADLNRVILESQDKVKLLTDMLNELEDKHPEHFNEKNNESD